MVGCIGTITEHMEDTKRQLEKDAVGTKDIEDIDAMVDEEATMDGDLDVGMDGILITVTAFQQKVSQTRLVLLEEILTKSCSVMAGSEVMATKGTKDMEDVVDMMDIKDMGAMGAMGDTADTADTTNVLDMKDSKGEVNIVMDHLTNVVEVVVPLLIMVTEFWHKTRGRCLMKRL